MNKQKGLKNMNAFKKQYTSQIVRNRRLYEYFYNGKKKVLEVRISGQKVGTATGSKATRIWKNIMDL